MAVSNNNVQTSEMASEREETRQLRAWRALFAEFYGRILGLEEFRCLLGMSPADALSSLGLGNVAWAEDRRQALLAALA